MMISWDYIVYFNIKQTCTHAIYNRDANALKSYLVHFRAIYYVCYAITDICPSILLNFCYISYRYTVKKGIPHGSQCSHVSQKKTCYYTRQCLVMRNSGLIPYRVTRFWLPGIIFRDNIDVPTWSLDWIKSVQNLSLLLGIKCLSDWDKMETINVRSHSERNCPMSIM